MEFNEKLQTLRKQKGLTQEELAERLFVSRTAVSKWESGRGYPNIDSLKTIAKLFSVTIDELLSGEEALNIAEEEHKEKEKHFCSLAFGLLDCSSILFFFLPLFGQKNDSFVQAGSLLSFTKVSPWLKSAYFILIIGALLWGILTLALQNRPFVSQLRCKNTVSFLFSIVGTLLFILSRQPYAAAFLFIFLVIKVVLRAK